MYFTRIEILLKLPLSVFRFRNYASEPGKIAFIGNFSTKKRVEYVNID